MLKCIVIYENNLTATRNEWYADKNTGSNVVYKNKMFKKKKPFIKIVI